MPSPMRRGRRLAALLPLAVAGCFSFDDIGRPADNTVTVALFADTVRLGDLVFFRTFRDANTPDEGTRIFLRVGDRPIEEVSILLQPIVTGSGAECATPQRPAVDVRLTNLAAREERTVSPGGFTTNVAVYVGSARIGGRSVTSAFAGRWTGTVTEFGPAGAATRTVQGASRSDGALVLGGTTPEEVGVLVGDVGTRRRLLGHDGRQCGRNWVVDSAATFVRTGDSLIVRGRVGSPTGAELTLDSIRLLLRAR